jgi:hypothetical protein
VNVTGAAGATGAGFQCKALGLDGVVLPEQAELIAAWPGTEAPRRVGAGTEVVMDRAPRREATWQQSSLAARAKQVEDRADHRLQIRRPRPTPRLGRRQMRLDDRPPCVAHVRVVSLDHALAPHAQGEPMPRSRSFSHVL